MLTAIAIKGSALLCAAAAVISAAAVVRLLLPRGHSWRQTLEDMASSDRIVRSAQFVLLVAILAAFALLTVLYS